MHHPNSPTTIYPAGTAVPQLSDTYEIAFGTYGSPNSLVTSSTLTFGSGAESGTIAFSQGDLFTPASGVYQGDGGNAWPPATNSSGTSITNDYLAAEPNNNIVTINFNSAQEYFGLLWGSMNEGNTLNFYDGNELVGSISYNGADLVTTIYDHGHAKTYETPENTESSLYVAINIPGGFTSVVASSSNGGFEFANVTYAAHPPCGACGAPAQVTPYDCGTPLCFLEGTLITTPDGLRPVESIQAGDLVLTAQGQAEAVRWVGVRKVAARFADKMSAFPVRIAAGALDEALPVRDLHLSPEHAVLVNGILINAAALVNGVTITREMEMPEIFTYYHVELASHALILAEGAPAETFLDNVERLHFDNWATHPGDAVTAEMDLPRAKGARQVPAAIRSRLLARATTLMRASEAA